MDGLTCLCMDGHMDGQRAKYYVYKNLVIERVIEGEIELASER